MVAYRGRGSKPAVALWLVVLGVDGVAVGTVATMMYVLAAIVTAGMVVGVVRCRGRLEPQPARARACLLRGRPPA